MMEFFFGLLDPIKASGVDPASTPKRIKFSTMILIIPWTNHPWGTAEQWMVTLQETNVALSGVIFRPSIFRGYVSFMEGKSFDHWMILDDWLST